MKTSMKPIDQKSRYETNPIPGFTFRASSEALIKQVEKLFKKEEQIKTGCKYPK